MPSSDCQQLYIVGEIDEEVEKMFNVFLSGALQTRNNEKHIFFCKIMVNFEGDLFRFPM